MLLASLRFPSTPNLSRSQIGSWVYRTQSVMIAAFHLFAFLFHGIATGFDFGDTFVTSELIFFLLQVCYFLCLLPFAQAKGALKESQLQRTCTAIFLTTIIIVNARYTMSWFYETGHEAHFLNFGSYCLYFPLIVFMGYFVRPSMKQISFAIFLTFTFINTVMVYGLGRWQDSYFGNFLVLAAPVAAYAIYLFVSSYADVLFRHLFTSSIIDYLTKTLNRRGLDFMVQDAAFRGACTAWLLDLDFFKTVNDQHGHATGDGVLVQLANRLVAMSEKLGRGTVFRLGGDEFLFVIPDERLSEAEIADINRDLLALMSEPVRVGNLEIQVGASIGFYSCDEKQAPITDLLRRLDMAMYQSKRTGRNRATEAVDPADYASAF